MNEFILNSCFPHQEARELALYLWSGDGERATVARRFALDETPERAVLFYCGMVLRADGGGDVGVRATVNGRRFAQDAPATAWHINRPLMLIQDVTPFLKNGANALTIEGDAWNGLKGLMAVLVMRFADGRIERLQTDEQWVGISESGNDLPIQCIGNAMEATPGPCQVFPGLTADVRGLPELYPGMVDGVPEARLMHEWREFDRVVGFDGVVTVNVPCDGAALVDMEPTESDPNPWVVLDAGAEMCGSVALQLCEDSAARLHIQCAESVAEALNPGVNSHSWVEFTVDVPAGGVAMVGELGFRFVKITVLHADGPVRFETLRTRTTELPLQQRGRFSCSDPLLDDIWQVSARTAHLCLQTGLWDGIKRDRLEWAGDLHVETEVIYNAFGDASVIKESLEHLRIACDWPRVIQGIPGYTAYWAMAYELIWRYEADRDTLQANLPHLAAVGDWFAAQFGPDFLWSCPDSFSPLIDWAWIAQPECVKGTHFQLVAALDACARLAEVLEQQELVSRWREVVKKAQTAAREAWYDPMTRLFSDRQQINAWAWLSGCAPADAAEAIAEDLSDPRERFVSPFQNYYVLVALGMLGHHEHAVRIVRDYWGAMLRAGATSFWEVFDPRWVTEPSGIDTMPGPDGDTHQNLWTDAYGRYRISLCHGWAGGPAAFLSEQVLGITPAEAGFTAVRVRPHPAGLQWAEGTVPTPRGDVSVRWELRDGRIDLTVDAPDGMQILTEAPEGFVLGNVTRR